MAAADKPAIEVRHLTKSYGNTLALDGINLEVETGETLAIFGPNGAGKTTLIKILDSIIKPTTGEVYINGLNLKDNAEVILSRIGIVCHQTFLYGNLTAFENLHFYSRMYDVPYYKHRIHQVASMVGMESRLHDRVSTLSRGMQQRFAITRALLHKPDIVLLDEPETGLDQQAIAMLWQLLKEDGYTRRTVIFTSHSLEHGLNACDHLIILNKGRVSCCQPGNTLGLAGLKQLYKDSTESCDEAAK
jgi:ABC-type multidrug transport system ATPase subunit